MCETGLLCSRVDELLAAFLKFREVYKLTEANGVFKKFGFPKCVGEGGEEEAVDDTHTH